MNQDNSEIDPLEMSVSASMARQYAGDSRSFLKSLAILFESALPGEATVQRSGLFGGDKRPIKRIEVSFSEDGSATSVRYVIEDSGHGPLMTARTQIVRGVALKTETIPTQDWIAAIGGAISRRAAQSKATRDALESLL